MPKSFNHIYVNRRQSKLVKDLNSPVEILGKIDVDFEGKTVQKTSFVIDDPKTRFKGLQAVDFALENLQVAGVNLQPVKCSLQTSEIEAQIDNANNLVVKQTISTQLENAGINE